MRGFKEQGVLYCCWRGNLFLCLVVPTNHTGLSCLDDPIDHHPRLVDPLVPCCPFNHNGGGSGLDYPINGDRLSPTP